MAGTGNDREIENTRSKTGFGRTLRSEDWLKKKKKGNGGRKGRRTLERADAGAKKE